MLDTGTLTLSDYPREREEAVVKLLCALFKTTKPEIIKARLAKGPLVLSKKIGQAVAQKIIERFESLGATIIFSPHGAEASSPQKKKTEQTNLKAPAREQQRKILLSTAFEDKNISSPVPLSYRLGLFVVALTMVVLPIVYLALIAAFGYLVYYHAVENLTLFQSVHSIKLALLMYITPLVTGILLVLFMIKPLFSRQREDEDYMEITENDEPFLFSFVEKICSTVGAPLPSAIHIDNEINASASFRRGMGSFFGHDLVLTIGLPLVGGMNIHEFSGVLAHEFGHFAQISAMRMTYLIRSINHWFARVVYEEDQWDVQLREYCDQSEGFFGIILYIARFFIWLTRRLLWVLMHIGHVISCFMLRQMEFDADRYEASLVGSGVFETTSNKLALLSTAHAHTFKHLHDSWREGKPPNNMAVLTRLKMEGMDSTSRNNIISQYGSMETGLFDTHPSHKDRVAAAGKVNTAPLLAWPDDGVPGADILFNNFNMLSRRLTLKHYKQAYGRVPDKKELIDVTEAIKSQDTENIFLKALENYFPTPFLPLYCVQIPDTFPQEPPHPKQLLADLQQARTTLAAQKNPLTRALNGLQGLVEKQLAMQQGIALLEAGFKIKHKEFHLPKSELEAARKAEEGVVQRIGRAVQQMQSMEELFRKRLVSGTRLAGVTAVRARIEKDIPFSLDELGHLWTGFTALRAQSPILSDIRATLTQLDMLGPQMEQSEPDEKLLTSVKTRFEKLHALLSDLRKDLKPLPYPLDHADKNMSIGLYLIKKLPDEDDLGAIHHCSVDALDAGEELIRRLAGRLALVAETVEKIVLRDAKGA